MKKGTLLSLFILAVVVAVLSCSPSPTPTAKPTTTSAPTTSPKPTVTAATSPAPTAKAIPSPTQAQAPAQAYFAGKTITMVVSSAAGGGTDFIARVYARYLSNHLPGKPSMVVRNMLGGGGTNAPNFVYSQKPDGLTVLIGSGSNFTPYLAKWKATKYDLQKMDAVLGNSSGIYFYTKPSVISKADDLPKAAKDLVFGHSTSGSPATLLPIIVKLLDIRLNKMVFAYGGAGDARRAFLSGEINISADGDAAYATLEPFVTKGEAVALFQSGIISEKGDVVKDPGLAVDIPTPRDLYEKFNGKAPSGMAWDAYKAFLAALRTYQGVWLLPPDTPNEILRIYWDAADKMLKDQEFRKTIGPIVGEKTPWWSGEAFAKSFRTNMVVDDKVLDWLTATLAEVGVVLE